MGAAGVPQLPAAQRPPSAAEAEGDSQGLALAGAALQALLGDTDEAFFAAARVVASIPEGVIQFILLAGGEAATTAQEEGLGRNAGIRAGDLCVKRLCHREGLNSKQTNFVARLYSSAFARQVPNTTGQHDPVH